MSAALVTAVLLSIGALVAGTYYGFTATTPADVLRHTTVSIFATFMVLLSHSMLMFYLIGKGKAVREAAAEGGLDGRYAAEIARVRRPVFSRAMLAIVLTMMAAILGGGVDTGVLPGLAHSVPGVLAVFANLAAFRAELTALVTSSRVVTEVDRALARQETA